MTKEKPTQTRYDSPDAPADYEDLAIEFFDDDEPVSAQASTRPLPDPPRRAVAKAVVTKSTQSQPKPAAISAKSNPAKTGPTSIIPAAQKSVATAVFSKRGTTRRPIAKAVMKAVPKKPPAPDRVSRPETPAGADLPAQDKPVAQIVARPNADPQQLMRQALRAHGNNQLDEAAELYRRILYDDPEFAPAWINLGVLLRRTGKLDAAVICLKRGIALKPDDGPAWSNLGNALRSVNRLDEALSAQRRALDLSSGVARIHYNYGLTVRDKGDLAEAGHALRRAGLLGYDAPELPWDVAITNLLGGNLRSGFDSYESRWNLPEATRMHRDLPEWDGMPLKGRSLLVWAEQGLGDTLHFARYLAQSAGWMGASGDSPGDRIVFEVQAPLARLLQRSPEFAKVTVIPRGAKLPPCDMQVPLLSLARLRRTELESIPDHCPYIQAPPGSLQPTGLHSDRLKVGICWAGKPSHKNDRNRSCTLSHFAGLFDLPGIDFLSLQKGPAVADIQTQSLVPLLRDMGSGFRDFADTAATIRALDLVITVDTSIAHLAGAMARPVWVLLPYAPDWRWMLHRDDSPWYPSMTLFRQTSPGDWSEVFTRIRQALIRKLRSFR